MKKDCSNLSAFDLLKMNKIELKKHLLGIEEKLEDLTRVVFPVS